jgi:hypothetical protein
MLQATQLVRPEKKKKRKRVKRKKKERALLSLAF